MSIRGRWQVVEAPGYDMALAGAYILFEEAGGEFAFDCLTGSIHGASHGDTVEFGWHGNDEMEPAEGDGWAELQDDGSLEGEISKTSSTACRLMNPLRQKLLAGCCSPRINTGRAEAASLSIRCLIC
ncbi:hypothetical protein ACVMIH_007634 [Bradyrhizobium sp. USDA 4503]